MLILFAYLLVAGTGTTLSNAAIYDQRQTGKTNVRIEVKDAVVVAISDGEFGGDYDYNYDYSDFTIKPGQPVSSTSPSSSSSSSATTQQTQAASSTEPVSTTPNYNHTQNAGVVLEVDNYTIIFPANKPGNASADPVKIISNSHEPDQIPVVLIQKSHGKRSNKLLPVIKIEKNYVPSSPERSKSLSETAFSPEDQPAKRCSSGFVLDSHNRCKRRRFVREKSKPSVERRQSNRKSTIQN